MLNLLHGSLLETWKDLVPLPNPLHTADGEAGRGLALDRYLLSPGEAGWVRQVNQGWVHPHHPDGGRAFTNSSIRFNYLTLGSNQVERPHKYSLLRKISHDQICFSVSPSTTRAFSHGSACLYLASRSTQLFYIRPGSCPIIWLVFAVGEYCEIVHQVTVATLNAKTST